MSKRHSLEKLFQAEATHVGLEVRQPSSIRIKKPVENSGGKKGKVVTTPDFFVVNPLNGKGVHVEIVNGKGGGAHKAAQKRVVEAAGVQNYVQVTGHEIIQIQQTQAIKEKRGLLMKMLYWLICA